MHFMGRLSRQLEFCFSSSCFPQIEGLREINCFTCSKLFRNGILENTGEFSVSEKIKPRSANAL